MRSFAPLALSALIGAAPAVAEEYRRPPPEIAAIAEAPPTPDVRVSPDGRWLLILERPALRPIAEVARPEMRLAGLRFDPRTNGPSREGYATRLLLARLRGTSEEVAAPARPIAGLPEGARIRDVAFAPDGTRFAFALARTDEIELFCADVEAAKARRLAGRLNGADGDSPFHWLPDSAGLVARLIPEGRGAPPAPPEVPAGPIVQESLGRKAAARTYQDLLASPHDEALFEHYLTAQAAIVPLDGKAIVPIGPKGVVERADPSPDGRHVLLSTIVRPYSYLVPASRFPRRVEVYGRDGKLVKRIADVPLADAVPIGFGACPTGPRGFAWRADAPATLVWTEAQDGGDPERDAPVRDHVRALAAPFEGEPALVVALGFRHAGIAWGRDDLALVSESWPKTRRTRTWAIDPRARGGAPRILFDRSSEDRYGDPGTPLLRPGPRGARVLRFAADGPLAIYLAGEGATSEGNRPFLRRLDLTREGAEPAEVFRSAPPFYERPVEILDDAGRFLLLRRESPTEPPNYFVRDLEKGALAAATDFPHPYPQLRGARKELIRYVRADGVPLSATLHLPPGWKPEDGPLPTLFWAYPIEFKSLDAAGQVTGSPHAFSRIGPGSPLYWLARGYAIVDDPKMPIVGEGDVEPNDSYVEQLVASARAAVDEVVRRGVADPERCAIAGHSYGAFMAANLLAHTDLFRAGIARSGAYNRTLTPFGFQGEDRPLWKARDVYFRMSPFVHAEKIDEPLLLIHGADDENAGTFPMQSERLYAAIRGLGGTARLVLLPHEGHGYQARESVLHMLWEMAEWLDRHVKRASPRPPAPTSPRGR